MIDFTLHFHISCGGRYNVATLNRNASTENLIQIQIQLSRLGQPLFRRRVPGLSIRDFAASPNNVAPKCPELNAASVKAWSICYRLVLVSGC